MIMEALCYLGYLWAANQFCKKYLEASKRNGLLFVLLSVCGWRLLAIVNRRYFVPSIFLVMLNHILFIGLVLLLFQADKEKKILAASMLIAVKTLVGNFFVSSLCCLALFFHHTVKKIKEPLLSEREGEWISCVSFVMVILAVGFLSKHLASVFYGKTRKWYLTLAIPLLSITAMMDAANFGASHGIMVRSGGNMGLYYDQIFSHTEFCVLAVLSLLAAGFYVFGMEKIYSEQEKSSRYHSQIAVYEMLKEQHRQSERLRHDMKNHIIALSGLFQGKEWEKMGNYLKNMENSSFGQQGDMTGNKAVDALLYQKQKWAERENVQWECDVQMPKTCGINEFDFCVLFGNLLDNALKACERLQQSESKSKSISKSNCRECSFVNIQAKTVKKCFFLEVKNSMDRTEPLEGGFRNQRKLAGHGIGLLNVNDVVHKYHGTVHIEAENGIFVISILMPLNDAVMIL